MSIPPFNLGYPPDNSSLGQTKSTIRNNLDGTFLTLAVDHINNNGQPGNKPAGYHTIIHEVSQTSVATVTGYNQVFAGVPGTLIVNGVTTPAVPPNGDTQLYALTGAGALSQLTGHVSATSGYQWVGGILIQWGFVGAVTNGASVAFTIPFPHNCFNVQVTIDIASTVSPVGTNGVSTSGFTFRTTAAAGVPIFWFAIGS